jgi:hypothetical protein
MIMAVSTFVRCTAGTLACCGPHMLICTCLTLLQDPGPQTFCCMVLQKATQEARALSSMTRERDRLLQELTACNQALAAADVRASEQDVVAAQKAAQMLRVGFNRWTPNRIS